MPPKKKRGIPLDQFLKEQDSKGQALEKDIPEAIHEAPSWSFIPAKMQEQNDQISVLLDDVQVLEKKLQAYPKRNRQNVTLLTELTDLEKRLSAHLFFSHAVDELNERTAVLIDQLILNHEM